MRYGADEGRDSRLELPARQGPARIKAVCEFGICVQHRRGIRSAGCGRGPVGAGVGRRLLEFFAQFSEIRGPVARLEALAGRGKAKHLCGGSLVEPQNVEPRNEIRIRRRLFPIRESSRVLVPVIPRAGVGIDAQGDTNFGEVAEEIEMPVDHGHLQAVGKPDACGFADLVAPAVLQHSQNDHHDHGKNDDDRRELALFDGQFHSPPAKLYFSRQILTDGLQAHFSVAPASRRRFFHLPHAAKTPADATKPRAPGSLHDEAATIGTP